MGGLALRSNTKRNERLLAQPRLHALPNHFLQRPAVRDHLYLKPEHRARVKAEDRSHHGLGASRRMRDTNLKLACFPARWPLPFAVLPSMLLIPSAPFTNPHQNNHLNQGG